MNNKNTSFPFVLGNTMRSIAKKVRARFQEENFDMNAEQFWLLNLVAEKDEFIQSDLAQMLDKDKSAILRHVDTLEAKKWMVRVNDPTDRRKKFLVLTKSGEAMLEDARKLIDEEMKGLFKGISKDEIETCKSILLRIQQNG